MEEARGFCRCHTTTSIVNYASSSFRSLPRSTLIYTVYSAYLIGVMREIILFSIREDISFLFTYTSFFTRKRGYNYDY